jgi:hypothetical protein
MTNITSHIDEIPEGECFAIITIGSVHIPGDERSRSAPGHGYPERTEYFPQLQVFTDEEEWKQTIGEMVRANPRQKLRAFVMKPASITTSVLVNVG